jgi:hypothetical protein
VRSSTNERAKTWEVLLEHAKYMQKRLVYLGGGVAGLAIFGTEALGSDIFKDEPWLRVTFLLLSLAAGASIGWAWEPCIRSITRIERHHKHHLNGVSLNPEQWFPERKILFYNNLALLFIIGAASVFLSAAFLSAI